MRISDWSSDVCSSDLLVLRDPLEADAAHDLAVRALGAVVALAAADPGRRLTGLGCPWGSAGEAGTDAVPPLLAAAGTGADTPGSEERRGGKECVGTCRSRWQRYP